MAMRKLRVLALMLVLALTLSACSMVKVDTDMDNAETAVEVNGTVITKGEAMQQFSNYKTQLQYQYAMYQQYFGYTMEMPSDDELRVTVTDMIAENEMRRQKAAELGMDQLSEDETAEVAANAQTTYDSYLEQAKTQVTEEGMSDEEITAAGEQYLVDNGITMELITEDERLKFVDNKLTEYTYQDLTVTDDEISAELTRLSDEDKAGYEGDPTYIDNKVNGGSTVYYYPAGYRYVKNLLVQFTEEDAAAMTELQSQLTDIETQISDYEAAIATPEPTAEPGPEATPEVTEEPAATEETEPTAVPTLDPEVYTQRDELNSQIAVAKLTQIANIRDKVNEVYQKVLDGEDFDVLIAEYGEDTGMTAEPAKTYGYVVGANTTNYVTEFKDASMALANVGDVSEPVETTYGMHIIKYASDIPEGTAELTGSLKQTIHDSLMTTKKSEKDAEIKKQWLAEAKISKYPERLVTYE